MVARSTRTRDPRGREGTLGATPHRRRGAARRGRDTYAWPVTHATVVWTGRRSARFVAWVRTWRAGLISYDDVADEIEADEDHLVCDADDPAPQRRLRQALAEFSSLHPDQVRLVLPAPGDPRGLPGPGAFSAAALVRGEAVVAGDTGLVPEIRDHRSGSGDTFTTVVWRCYALPAQPGPPEPPVTPAEAEAELVTALAEATTRLRVLDVARWRPELAGAVADLRRHDDAGDLPPVFNPRARRLYARASLLDRMLVLAQQVGPGGAVDAYEAQRREEVLRPLQAACRRALMAACNAPVDR